MPRVSIIIRTKNRPVFLARALLSVQQQGFQDWEAIIVNDGGDAAPLEQLLSAIPDVLRERISIIHHETSQGMEAASNAGVRVARGDLLAIHDDDDSWHGTFLTTMVGTLDRAPASIAGVACHAQCVDEIVVDGAIVKKGVRPFNNGVKNITLFRLAARNFIPPISFLYRASVHEKVGMYRAELPVLGDWDFYMRVLSRFDIQLVPRVLANYHIRPADAGEQYGNSVVAGAQTHVSVEAQILNAMLREDLAAGKIGLGTVASLAYDLREIRESTSTTKADIHHIAQVLSKSVVH